ncbi:MAG: hypothetical protein ACOYT9_03720 [Patescibacteria group bacterium]
MSAAVTREDEFRKLSEFPPDSLFAQAIEDDWLIHPQNVTLVQKLATRAFDLLGMQEDIHSCHWQWSELKKGVGGFISEPLSYPLFNIVVGVTAPFGIGPFVPRNYAVVIATANDIPQSIRKIRFEATKTAERRINQEDPRQVAITYNDGKTAGTLTVGTTSDNKILTYDWAPLRGRAPELQEQVFEAVKDTPLASFLQQIRQDNFSETVFALMTQGQVVTPEAGE